MRKFELIFFPRLPFDWKTPLGYLIAVTFLCVTAYCVFFSAVPILGIAIGSSILANTAIDVATSDVNQLKEMTDQSHLSHIDMLKRFCSIIEDISDIKELSQKAINLKVTSNE